MFPIKVASWWYTLIHVPHFQRTPGHPVNPKNLGKNVGIPEYHLEIPKIMFSHLFSHSQQHGITIISYHFLGGFNPSHLSHIQVSQLDGILTKQRNGDFHKWRYPGSSSIFIGFSLTKTIQRYIGVSRYPPFKWKPPFCECYFTIEMLMEAVGDSTKMLASNSSSASSADDWDGENATAVL